ncbi:MAG: amidoligase family protein [Pseudomonadota bacterium]
MPPETRCFMTDYPPLPLPNTTDHRPRRVGVEIEFAGLSQQAVVACTQDILGGRVAGETATEVVVADTELGDIRIELDTRLTKFDHLPGARAVLDVARTVVPVEIVTQPLLPTDMPRMDALCGCLRDHGARGSRDGMLYGFGVHLNPEVIAPDHPHTCATIMAYALLEPTLRKEMHLDPMRRLLPFVDPWPPEFVDALRQLNRPPLNAIAQLYAGHITSRNHGLDLLPLFFAALPEASANLFAGVKSQARPTFHFRLPESRIDEAGWTLRDAWAQWHAVETLAQEPARLAELIEEMAPAHGDP